MGLTPINHTSSIVSKEIGIANIVGRTVSTLGATGSNIISRTGNAISKVFSGTGKILRHGTAIGLTAAAALTFPISAPAIYGALATGKFVKNKVEGKGRGESLGNAITRPLGADTVAKYTDLGKVGEGIKDITMGAGGEVLKGAVETITIPLIGAKLDDSSNSGQVTQAVSSPSSTESPTSTPPSNSDKPKTQETPIPTPSPSTPPSNSDKPKTQKEIDAEKKKEEEKQKKEEEKIAKEETKKSSEEIKKKAESYGKSIDKIIPKLEETKTSIETNRKSDEKAIILNEIEEKINKFGLITNDYNSLLRKAKSNGSIEKRNVIDKPELLYTTLIETKDFIADKMLSVDGDFDKYHDLPIDKRKSISIRALSQKLDSYAQDIETSFKDTTTTPHTWKTAPTTTRSSYETNLLLGTQNNLSEYLDTINNGLEYKEKEFNKEIKKINDIKPSDLKKQEDKISEHIGKLSSLLQTSKGKIAAEKGNFWSGKITSINIEYIKEISEEISELQNELGGLSSGGEKSVHRKDIEKQLSPLFGKINETFQALNN